MFWVAGSPPVPRARLWSGLPGGPNITWARVETADAASRRGPAPSIHLIDVGTGPSIPCRRGLTLLYDAGMNDRGADPHAHTFAALPLATIKRRPPAGADPVARSITSCFSHPHFDHASAMDLVLHCYDVHNVGLRPINEAVAHRDFEAVARSTADHTAASVPDDHSVTIKGSAVTLPAKVLAPLSRGDAVPLGETAKFTILHADPKNDPDINVARSIGATRQGECCSPGFAVGQAVGPELSAGRVEEFLITITAAHPRRHPPGRASRLEDAEPAASSRRCTVARARVERAEGLRKNRTAGSRGHRRAAAYRREDPAHRRARRELPAHPPDRSGHGSRRL
jgi:hypothetical protein